MNFSVILTAVLTGRNASYKSCIDRLSKGRLDATGGESFCRKWIVWQD